MAIDNTITISGNLTRDPELKFLGSGTAVADLSVAVNRKDKDGNESTSFIDVTAWQTLAENVAESLTRGARVIVTGRLEQQTWEDKDGGKRSKLVLIADDVAPSLKWATAIVTKGEATNRQPATVGASSEPF